MSVYGSPINPDFVAAHPGSPFERDDAYEVARSTGHVAQSAVVFSTRDHFEPIPEQALMDSAGAEVIPFGEELKEGGLDG